MASRDTSLTASLATSTVVSFGPRLTSDNSAVASLLGRERTCRGRSASASLTHSRHLTKPRSNFNAELESLANVGETRKNGELAKKYLAV